MTIHILTLTWQGLDKLQKVYDGLAKSIIPTGHSAIWYIRDNGSTDGTAEWLERREEFNFVESKNNHLQIAPMFVNHNRDNFAQGVNSLYEKAAPKMNDFILLLNNDIVFSDDVSLKNMLQLMDNSKIGVVGARLLYNDSNKLQHAGVIMGPRYGNMPFHYRHKEESDKDAEKNRYFQAVTAACCLVRVKAWQTMDHHLSWAFEDIDLNFRIGQAGWKIAYCGQTTIYHEESATLIKNPVNKMFMPQNVKRFKDKWFGKYDIDHEKYLNDKNYNLIKD
jgi:GT2 family glycosyltransferase